MTIKISQITNLRVEGSADHRASINFEAGDRRFHIWLVKRESGWQMENTIHSNPIEDGSHRDHRELDMNAAAHQKLRTFLAEHIGDISRAAYESVELMVAARQQADLDHRKQLADNIRESLNDRASRLPLELTMALRKLDDHALIELRGAIYGTKYPEQTYPNGVLGIALAKEAA